MGGMLQPVVASSAELAHGALLHQEDIIGPMGGVTGQTLSFLDRLMVRTPFFIVVRVYRDEVHEVVYTKLGAFTEIESFLEPVLEVSGLREKDSPSEKEVRILFSQ